MEVRHIYHDGRVKVQVEHGGVVLIDYAHRTDQVIEVEARLVALAWHLTPQGELR